MSYADTILITGGTSGLGYQCALALARQHPTSLIIVASRSDRNSSAAAINQTCRQGNVKYVPLDLSSLAAIREFSKTWSASNYPPIISLVLNAGLQFPTGLHKTVDGVEATFGVNHVGHALLFHLLAPYLAHSARIVVVASGTHDPEQKTMIPDAKYTSAAELAFPTGDSAKNPDGRQRYSTSKLCNVLWTYALSRRLTNISGKKLSVIAMDPGLMPGTSLTRNAGQLLRFFALHVGPHLIWLLRLLLNSNVHSPKESGEALAWLATSSEIEGENGVYFEGRKKIKSSGPSYDENFQEDLWNWTVKHIAVDEEERERFEAVA